jgi:CheY-like chemotaxis protein
MTTEKINLLLADDDTDDCLFFQDALNDFGIATALTIVHNGVELMKLLTQKEYKLPHALYLDLNMPRKSGFECLSEIRLNESLKQLPVIIFSTSFDKEVVKLLHERGANYYIRKPAEFSNFKKIILKSITLITENKNRKTTKEEFVISN